MVSIIADWCGIAGFLLTIWLLIRSEAMRKEIEAQRTDYRKEQREIKQKLIALRSNVIDDNVLNQKVISDIRTQLFTYQQKFKRLLSKDDKRHMKATLEILDTPSEKIDARHLCRELDYFVARFERKEIR
ncbi:MAG: hypothetical protein HDT16_02045 [Oscillibacter sp.]|nr:hypothetical protein [Oscillibacter sp.]